MAKVNVDTFPSILSKVMLKSSIPPGPPNDDIWIYTQILCFLYMEKPATRKCVYHMFLSTEKYKQNDFDRVRKMYENRKDLQIVDQLTENALCARTLYRRVQKMFPKAIWNKQGNVFEVDMSAKNDPWAISRRLNKKRDEEHELLFNYIKYLSVTKD
nr:uncharacterized protein LOC108072322 [Drosophila kikkawai]